MLIKKYSKYILLVLNIIMSVQILLGCIWMGMNITNLPTFGDTVEYINLSQTLLLDEYRPVLYPLILRLFIRLADVTGIAYQIPLYLFQTGISFAVIFYAVVKITQYMKYECSFYQKLFVSLFFLTIPMITFMNFTVLTDSLANSSLVFLLIKLISICKEDKIQLKTCVALAFSLIIGSLLRADRVYSCLFVVAIVFIAKICHNSKQRKQLIFAMIFICVSTIGIVRGINHVTQTPGRNGRIKTDLNFVLLDRIVWPNMAAHYNYFSDDIKDIVSYDDAVVFDSHNNNVMYQMASMLEQKVGKEKAGKIYREMAKVVWKHSHWKVLKDISEDILTMAATPISSLLHYYGVVEKNDSWNITCMSQKTPELTKIYDLYYLYTLLLMLLGNIILIAKFKYLNNLKYLLKVIMPFVVMSAVITIWFSIGDGAPPNDRYALIIYILWSMIVLSGYRVLQPNP